MRFYSFCYVLLGFLLVWFLKHPALRYGGYVLIALPILIINSYFLTKFINSKKNITKKTFLIVVITIIIFNGRNRPSKVVPSSVHEKKSKERNKLIIVLFIIL